MSKKLFIVEAPGKVAKIKNMLSGSYVVTASVGHTYHLPTKDYVDFTNFNPLYEPDPKKKDVLKEITSLADKCDEIMYATDMDVEGSVIGWHLYEHLSKKYKNKTHTRVNVREITKSGLQKAIKESYPMTDPKEFLIVQSGFLRRLEDRFVGFKVSPLANIYVQEKTSAGRVQSPALRLIVEKEKEIEAFIPKVYFDIHAKLFPKDTSDVFSAKYIKEVTDEATAKLIVAKCKKATPKVSKLLKKQASSKAPSPFTTISLLASASTILGWKADRTTKVAQALYQSGHITYIRTDNPVISSEGKKKLRAYLQSNFTKDYMVSKLPDYNNKKAKLEHECIRPTNLDVLPKLTGDDSSLYQLIQNRFIACGMSSAVYDNVTAEVSFDKHIFKANGSTLVFDGFQKVWAYSKKKEVTLPALDEDTDLQTRDLYQEKKETKPPARFKDSSLIKTLEKMDIGTPSTVNSILTLLHTREYITYKKNSIAPTDLGTSLNDFLSEYLLKIVDYDFTARVENDRNNVKNGTLKYEDVIGSFYASLKEELKAATIKIAADRKDSETTAFECPTCEENLLLKKMNRKDKSFFFSCEGYVDKSCTATFSIDPEGNPVKSRQQKVFRSCPGKNCDGDLVERMNKRTKEIFYACSAWRSGCKVTASGEGEIRKPIKVKKHGKCKKCKKGTMVERTSKQGSKFLGCDNFPKCKTAESLETK